jgi:hypothetical protein
MQRAGTKARRTESARVFIDLLRAPQELLPLGEKLAIMIVVMNVDLKPAPANCA